MNKLLFWIVFTLISISLLGVFMFSPQSEQAGDIMDYYGVTETLMSHGGFDLTAEDKEILSNVLSPEYFNDPIYYNIVGREGKHYPVHFIFYSLLVLPVRLFLKLLVENEINSLRVTNVLIFTIVNMFILKSFIKSWFKKWMYMVIAYLSPLIWFLVWPGPDILVLSLLLLSVYLFFEKRYIVAALIVAIASWHSQPVLVVAIGMYVYWIVTHITLTKDKHLNASLPITKTLAVTIGLMVIVSLPYLYNLWTIGVLTPWSILEDGWTRISGFGMHNLSFKKFFEQWFDLNMGLFWYMPVLFIMGIILWIRSAVKSKTALHMLIVAVITAFLFQTNPGWHYGTSGFGPGRHGLFLIPFLIYFWVTYAKKNILSYILIGIFMIIQWWTLSFNGYLTPVFSNTHSHSPYALYMLNNFPELYNPTPEIFIDRTTHSDLSYPHTAIYKNNGMCKKAYIIQSDIEILINECATKPIIDTDFLSDPYKRKASEIRSVFVLNATLWPDPYSCSPDAGSDYPYKCIKSFQDILTIADPADSFRFSKVLNDEGIWMDGVWKIEKGLPVKINLPAGYIMDYSGIYGVYVTF